MPRRADAMKLWLGPALAVGLLAARDADARIYPVSIEIDTEDDLRALYTDGLIEESDFETLQALLDNPLDLNRARRGELYDLPGLSLLQVDAIIKARRSSAKGLVTVEELRRIPGIDDDALRQVRPFVEVVVKESATKRWPVHGVVRARMGTTFEEIEVIEDDHANRTHTAEQLGYPRTPVGYLTGRVTAQKWLKAGFVGLLNDDVRGVVYDADHRDFNVTWGPSLELGRAYVAADRMWGDAVIGSFAAGFGLGLTFDRTSRQHPHGLYPDLTISGTDSFSVPRRLFGAGAHLDALDLGGVSLDGTLFASSWRHDLYQYDMSVPDPTDTDDGRSSPRVYLDGEKIGWVTLPNAYREDLLGANVTATLGERSHAGLTAYVGQIDTRSIDGVESEDEWEISSGYPDNDAFGAVGLDGSWGTGPIDLFAEVAQSFTGGRGAVLQTVADFERVELDATIRRYDTDFDNPLARGSAAADEYEGMRDRDEQGLRLKVAGKPLPWLKGRFDGDIYQSISRGFWNLDLYGRVEVEPINDVSLWVFAQHRDQRLGVGGRTRVYGGEYSSDDFGDTVFDDPEDTTTLTEEEIVSRAGSKKDVGAQLRVDLIPRTSLQTV